MTNTVTRNGSKRSKKRYAWWLALGLLAGILIAWNARASILSELANRWVISESLERADAIVVLGGRMEVRPFAAADLYKRGYAPRILISNVARGQLEAMQLWPGQKEVTRQLLLKLGVPSDAIVEFGEGVTNTYEEARGVLEWARRTGAKRVIIPTDLFGTRRVRWVFKHEAQGNDLHIAVHGIKPRDYGLDDWWQDKYGLIDFQNEVLKYIYYRIYY